MNDDKLFYGIDFDGTLCENDFPNIGEPKQTIINYIKRLKECGHYIGLWTCREGKILDEAVEWCKEHGIVFDTINANLPERIEKWGCDCRKVGYDYVIDDKNLLIDDIEYIIDKLLNEKKTN